MRFDLRDFKAADFDRLYSIDQECFPGGIAYSRRELAHYIKLHGAFTLVAETLTTPPEIAGFIVARKHPKGMGHIITIDTAPKYRRCGLGTLLMNTVEQRLQATGCETILLEAAVDNLPAIRFYKRLDYFILKTLPRYYHNQLDAFLLVKRLPASS